MSYRVKLEMFEGPLDLLLHLIRKEEVDIYDIPIVKITHQFLEYLELMSSLNIDLAGEFLLMAATLVQIKSKMLLPRDETGDEAEDPRRDITGSLIEYIKYKDAASILEQRNLLDRDVFARISDEDWEAPELGTPEEVLVTAGLFDLIDAFKGVMDRLYPGQVLTLTPDEVSLEEKIAYVIDRLKESTSINFVELFSGVSTRGDIIVTFLALLELTRLGLIRIFQHQVDGSIRLFSRELEDPFLEDEG
ncbi:MAG: segregation/condensation protein A [Deltaproteobacteria bacterium]|nr:segregation/condensation protein A [Deltaproteobacteria bacterium]